MKPAYFILTASLFMQAAFLQASGLQLNLGNANSSAATRLIFDDAGSPGYDSGVDKEMQQLPGNSMNYIYSVAGLKRMLFINFIEKPENYIAVRIQIAVEKAGSFSFYAEDIAKDLEGFQYSLTDVTTGQTFSFMPGVSTEMTFTEEEVHQKKNYLLHIYTAQIYAAPVSCFASTNGAINVTFNDKGVWEARLRPVSSTLTQVLPGVNNQARFENLGAGIYVVEIWKDGMKMEEKTVSITQPAVLKSAFTVESDTIQLNQWLFPENFSKGGDRWYWQCDGQQASHSREPAYHFTQTGTYTLTLTASNTAGCISQTSRVITVQSAQPKATPAKQVTKF